MSVFVFSAALSSALAREALRQAAATDISIELAIATSTAGSAVTRSARKPLGAIVIDDSLADAHDVMTNIAKGPDKAKLLVVSNDPLGIARKYSIRNTQVIPANGSDEAVAEAIVARIKSLAPSSHSPRPEAQRNTAPAPGFKRREIVVLGCSTGGPEALAVVLGALPARFPVPIVVVQHMPPDFTRLLADRLDKSCALNVKEVTGPVQAKSGEVWIAPGHRHIKLANTSAKIELDDGPEENNCKPAVDVLFRSAASTYGRRAVGVVLTGMGDDGCRGGKLLSQSGAHMIAQDEATSVVWGMPGAAVRAGIVDSVLPLKEVAAEISQQFRPVTAGANA